MTEAQSYETTAFLEMIDAFRELQQTLCVVAPPPSATGELTTSINDVTNRLKAFAVPEGGRIARESGMQGVGHPVLVPYQATDMSDTTLTGFVTFSYAHMGRADAVHGGVITMLFDDLLGMFVVRKGQPHSRTAFLKVNYRNTTPVHRELRIDATIDKVEGRKTFLTGTLSDGDVVCADAEALFVQVLPGRP